MLIHHSFGFPNIFLKEGSRDPKDPPRSAPDVEHQLVFLESSRHGLASVFVSQCPKCHSIFRYDTSSMMKYNNESHYTTNVQAVLGQVATRGGGEHLEEQLACLQIPSVPKLPLFN